MMAREMKDSGITWIGEIPCKWGVVALKYLCSMNAGKTLSSEEILNKGEYAVYGGNGLRGYYSRYNNEGSYLLVGRQGALCGNVHRVDGVFWATEHAIVTICSKLSTRDFLYYLLIGMNLNRYASNTAAQPGLSVGEITNVRTVLVPIEEQQEIAIYLDKKCAEIDAVIAKTKATIEEYKKLKQAIITAAVTRGIRGHRPMKDSGFEWIGEIPVDWDVVRIKTLFDYRNERNYRPLEEVNLISLYTDLGVVQHCDLEETTGNKASNADGYKLVFEDDIVVNIILCWMGAIGRSSYCGVTSPAYDVYSPKSGTNSKFYHHLFRTSGFSGDCYKVGRGIMAMRWRTYSDQFRAIKVVSPPQEEQQEIVDYLEKKCAAIDALIAKKVTLLEELESYKKAIIYEYVTGKREV